MKIDGAGPEAPVVTNARGGKQSASPYRVDLLPPHACLAVGAILKHGADKYAAWNWRQIDAADHLNHAMAHCLYYVAGEESEGSPLEHLKHAATRILFALDVAILEAQGRKDP